MRTLGTVGNLPNIRDGPFERRRTINNLKNLLSSFVRRNSLTFSTKPRNRHNSVNLASLNMNNRRF